MKGFNMTPVRSLVRAAFCLAAVSAVAACGGGGGGEGGSGGGGAVTSTGAIQQFGSIVVNGVKYSTQGATLHLRDDNSSRVLQTEAEIQGLLERGMVVTVKGSLDDNGSTGTAREIEFRHQMEGRVDDKGTDFIVMMGQTIVVDDSIKGALAGIAVGDKVGISAIADDKGGLRASFLEKKNDNLTEFEAKGYVSNLSGNTFTLLLSRDAATGISVTVGSGVALPAGVTNGSFVEVRTLTAGGVITATSVELEDALKAGENEKLEFEGFVSSGTVSDFFVNGQQVTTSAGTVFVGGVPADFAVGTKVEVEGRLVGGVLVATEVVFKENVRIDAAVEAVGSGELTLLGKKVIIGSATDIRGLSGATLDASSLAVGQELEIRGNLAANGTDIVATRIDLKDASADPDLRPFLRGPVSAKDAAAGTLDIAGVAISTGAGTEFRDANDTALSAAQFFNAVTLNTTVVKVDWRAPFNSTGTAVRSAELEG